MKTRFILAALIVLAAMVGFSSCTEDSENSFSKEFVNPHEVEIDSTTSFSWATQLMEAGVDDQWQNYEATGITTKVTTADGEVTSTERDSVKVDFRLPHNVQAMTNWTSTQEAPTARTGAVVSTSTSTQDTSWVDGDFVVKATKVTTSYRSVVTLADGSSRNNEWKEFHFVNVVVSRGNDVLKFDNFTVATTNNAATANTGTNTYSYADTLSYTLGDNVKKVAAPGTITIKVKEPEPDTFFPKEWGKLLEVRQLHSLNENGTAGVDTWCMYFANDKVLPVVLPNGVPDYNFKLVETTTEKSYNGAAYNTSLARPRWQAVYGVKEASCISYTRESKVIEKVGYLQASRLSGGWNVDANGEFDCKIDRYSFNIKDGVFTAYKKGVKIGEWTYYNK